MIACPDAQSLIDFDSGRLSDSGSEVIADHVSGCLRCQALVQQLQQRHSPSGLGSRLRQCLQAMPLAPEEVDDAAIKAAAGMIESYAPSLPESPSLRHPAPQKLENVGPYVIHGIIGRGGMGVVYRTMQVALQRPVALKMLREGTAAQPEARLRFQTEARAVARLKHANVVQLYDFGEWETAPYFAMELVEGDNLAVKLLQGPLLLRDAANLVQTLARALEYAHACQVLHRDLKPANVLITADGTPKIVDFGLAKLIDESIDGPTVTHAIIGTPSYMAPEQAAGRAKDIDPRTDVYALGAILYETLTGHAPFAGQTRQETIRLLLETEPIRPSRRKADIPRDLEAICVKCLEKSRRRRYASAQLLADDLERWLRNERPKHTPSWLGRWSRWIYRHKWPVAAILTASTALVAVYVRDPNRVLERLQHELDQGRPVTLIGDTGGPKWYRWRAGESEARIREVERVFTIESGSNLVLIELLPSLQTKRAKFTCQVRHFRSDTPGEVGIYVAHLAYPGGPRDIQCFTQVSFNDVRRVVEVPIVVNGRQLPIADNVPILMPHIYSESAPSLSFDCRTTERVGPRYRPAGENMAAWRQLEVVIESGKITATWDGISFASSIPELRAHLTVGLEYMKTTANGNPFLRALQTEIAVQGGLGLYVLRGTASFRSANISPIPDAE